jgi:hypothetical protein
LAQQSAWSSTRPSALPAVRILCPCAPSQRRSPILHLSTAGRALRPAGVGGHPHLSRLRSAPILVVVTVFVIGLAGALVSRAGFAWVQPESFLAEEIAKDPTSPIAVAHEMARKNGSLQPDLRGLALLAALVMVAVDARGRPVLASVAYGMTVFVTVSATLARMPAFAQSLPSVPETALAAAGTVLAGVAGGVLASGGVEHNCSAFSQGIRGLIAARRVRDRALDRVTCGARGPRLLSLEAEVILGG